MSCVVPSVKVPVAIKGCIAPSGITGIAGVTAIDTSAADVTVSVAEPVIEPKLAVILLLPVATPLTSPWLFTDAIVELPEVQAAVPVTSQVLPSL